MPPQLIFGTAAFGMDSTAFQDAESVKNLLSTLKTLHIDRLDTAARYPPLNPGRSEELLGQARELSSSFIVDTKIYASSQDDGSGYLSRDSMHKSITGSLQRLQRPEGVNILYSHRADPSTPLEEQIRGFNEQIAQGHCKAWGVSNTPPEVLEKMLKLCEQNDWRKPSCYQGIYNVVSRGMEKKLLPILRSHGIAYIAFQALGGGFLTGKLVNNEHAGTRLADENPLGKAMQRLFAADDLHNAMRKFDTGAKAQGLTSVEIAIRWIAHHSALGDTDGIILGASKTTQIVETVGLAQKGPLPAAALALVEEAWDAVKETRGEIIG